MTRIKRNTPKWARRLRNAAITIAAAVPISFTTIQKMGMRLNPVVEDYLTTLTCVCIFLSVIFHTQSSQDEQSSRKNKR